MRLLPVLSLCSLALAGCSTLPPSQLSYADPGVTLLAAKTIAEDAATEVARRDAPARTLLIVSPVANPDSQVAAVVEAALRGKGFGVRTLTPPPIDPDPTAPPLPSGIALRYQLSSLDGMTLARVYLGRNLLARAYSAGTATTLPTPLGPWTDMETPN